MASICRHLDGIPLAVELAAATRMFTPEQIDGRLDDRFRLLTAGARDDLDHHRTIEATIDWSYQLLDPQQQEVFARLGVFAGSFTLDAAEQVCADESLTTSEVMDAVVHLADSSLLEVEQSGEGVRYGMLETVRAFAGERLADTGEESRFRSQHAAFFAELAEIAYPQLWGPDEIDWLTRLRDDYGNLRQALSWTATTGDTQTALRMAGALYRFWGRSRQIGEGMMWLSQLLALDQNPSAARARALVGAAYLSAEERTRTLDEAVALYRQFGPDHELAAALINLGSDRSAKGRREEAMRLFEESIEIGRGLEAHAGIALAAGHLTGYFAEVVGDFDQALAYANESVDAARRSGSPELLANLLSEQATVHRRRGDFDQAESLLEEVVAIEATHAGTFNLPSGAIGMALLFHDIGDHKRAYRHMIQAVEEERTWRTGGAVGWGSNTINRLRYLGLIEAARGNHRRATVILSATEAAASQVGQVPNPHDQEWLNTTITQLQETLGREAFQSAWDRGAGMSRDEAYDYALNLPDDA